MTRQGNGIDVASYDQISFKTGATSGISSGAERMRITSAGNVGIGTSSPTVKLDVNGAIATSASGASSLLFKTSGTTNYSWANQYPSAGNFSLYDHGAGATVLTVNAGNLGLGATNTYGFKQHIFAGASTFGQLISGSATGVYTNWSDGSATNSPAIGGIGNNLVFATGPVSNAERMRITDGGNVGIGTTSPSNRLQVNATNNTAYSPSNTLAGGVLAYVKNASTTNSTDATIRLEATGSNSLAASSISSVHTGDGQSALTFGTRTNGASDVTEKMRLDSAGNLGLGVTPSAWGATYRALDIRTGAIYDTPAGTASGMTFNAIYNGTNWEYKGTGGNATALRYEQGFGQHQWFTAPTGIGGNPITFTQTMTLDASGRLLIGTTGDFGGAALQVVKANSTGLDANIRVSNNVDTSMMLGTVAANVSGIYSSGAIAFGTGNNTFTERARIDSAGNLGLGFTPSAWFSFTKALQLNYGAFAVNASVGHTRILNNAVETSSIGYVYQTTNPANNYTQALGSGHQWFTAPSGTAGDPITFTQAMTLDASGNVQIGSTTNSFSARIYSLETSATEKNNVALYTTGAHNTCRVALYNDSGAASVQSIVGALSFSSGGVGSGSERMRIASDGNVGIGVASPTVKLDVAGSILASGNVTAYSDIRVKDNVESIEGAIGKLSQIRGVTYTRTDLDDKQRRFAGVIAQEIEQVLPEAVFDNGKVKAVDYNATIALLIEAVKEQQKRIDKLETLLNKGN
jgi:hypothetical protein